MKPFPPPPTVQNEMNVDHNGLLDSSPGSTELRPPLLSPYCSRRFQKLANNARLSVRSSAISRVRNSKDSEAVPVSLLPSKCHHPVRSVSQRKTGKNELARCWRERERERERERVASIQCRTLLREIVPEHATRLILSMIGQPTSSLGAQRRLGRQRIRLGVTSSKRLSGASRADRVGWFA